MDSYKETDCSEVEAVAQEQYLVVKEIEQAVKKGKSIIAIVFDDDGGQFVSLVETDRIRHLPVVMQQLNWSIVDMVVRVMSSEDGDETT